MTELYKDEVITISPVENAAANGHLKVTATNQEFKSLNDISDIEAQRLFLGASQVAVALFELVQAQGTNIVLTESDQALSIEVLARKENDGLDMLWQPTQGNPQELQSVAKSIKDAADILLWEKNNPNAKKESSKAEPTVMKEEKTADKEDKPNYLLKRIKRVPW